jgi:hemoglobin-like flavoprotein
MTPAQTALVQSTFPKVSSQPDKAAALFYEELFALAPELRALFKGDLEEQGRRLMDMLAKLIGGMNRPESLLLPLFNLGRKHKGYGVQKEHFRLFGTAYLKMLEKMIGPAFTPEVHDAYLDIYKLAAGVMRKAM